MTASPATALARQAHRILQAGVAAVQASHFLTPRLWRDFSPGPGPLRLVACGKAALAMAGVAQAQLQEPVCEGLVVVPHGTATTPLPAACPPPVAPLRIMEAAHPVPDAAGLAAAEAALTLAERTAADGGRLLVLVSGGASALLAAPPASITLEEMQVTGRLLLRSGASIHEFNTVRRHLSRIGGGRLALAAGGRPLLACVLSDVAGDDLSAIASGPTVADATTFAVAIEITRRYNVWDALPPAVRAHLERGADDPTLETPAPGDARLSQATTVLVASLEHALRAAAQHAEAEGIALAGWTHLEGDAGELARRLAGEARQKLAGACGPETVALLWGGEPTVTVRGSGHGGRCQELALAFALEWARLGEPAVAVEWCFAALSSDGADGVAPAGEAVSAGAWVDGSALAEAGEQGLDGATFLAANDTHRFFRALGRQIISGPTHTNVTDLQLFLARRI